MEQDHCMLEKIYIFKIARFKLFWTFPILNEWHFAAGIPILTPLLWGIIYSLELSELTEKLCYQMLFRSFHSIFCRLDGDFDKKCQIDCLAQRQRMKQNEARSCPKCKLSRKFVFLSFIISYFRNFEVQHLTKKIIMNFFQHLISRLSYSLDACLEITLVSLVWLSPKTLSPLYILCNFEIMARANEPEK